MNRTRLKSRRARVGPALAAAGVVLWAVAGGCAPRGASVEMPESAAAGRASGDWDDVDAAVEAGANKSEMVFIKRASENPREAVYELRSVRDEPGILVVGRGEERDEFTMRCSIGRFGDPDRERKLMEDVASRLRQLAGVGAAPIR